ncbi:MAG: FdtA/QdtA family cupin domain-containing protein [Chitinophagales bacterium]|nr:FdtA/QdtA family cupin domain-containing protein [Chitinophagales bacterium]
MNVTEPHLIEFQKIGEPITGYISVFEFEKEIPFPVLRSFWTYYTPESIVRGRHAHKLNEQILIAVAGQITVNTERRNGILEVFRLNNPNVGLYIPPFTWTTMQYSHNAVQLVLCSKLYDETEYIRNYEVFKI